MAVVVELHVAGTHDQHDAVDAEVGRAIEQMGGPPAGLMFHLTRPDRDGFVMTDVWRTEDEARKFIDEVVLPAMTAAGAAAGEPSITPVWGMARP